MEYIRVTNENIEKEHICCAISNNNDIQVSSKKEWLKERFDDGLVFLKSEQRGKCFIEYIPEWRQFGYACCNAVKPRPRLPALRWLPGTDEYFEAPYEEYPITICGQTVILTNGE